jgi:hypothetical protein
MRLWSLHPQYLDAKGLVALWREALLAQNVLLGKTKAYQHHPQLDRFKKTKQPPAFLATYLAHVYEEALARGYQFDRKKIARVRVKSHLTLTRGQLHYEFKWLLAKLKKRDPKRYRQFKRLKRIMPHPLFRLKNGPVASWEKIKPILNRADTVK